jgi:hypothetical protein
MAGTEKWHGRLFCQYFWVDTRVSRHNGRWLASVDTPDGPTLAYDRTALSARENPGGTRLHRSLVWESSVCAPRPELTRLSGQARRSGRDRRPVPASAAELRPGPIPAVRPVGLPARAPAIDRLAPHLHGGGRRYAHARRVVARLEATAGTPRRSTGRPPRHRPLDRWRLLAAYRTHHRRVDQCGDLGLNFLGYTPEKLVRRLCPG